MDPNWIHVFSRLVGIPYNLNTLAQTIQRSILDMIVLIYRNVKHSYQVQNGIHSG